VIGQLLRASFFRQKPPRTAGREEFGREYVSRFLQICRGASKPDVVATATALDGALDRGCRTAFRDAAICCPAKSLESTR
jgi:hypothetical protein